MEYTHYDLGQRQGGEIVEITLRGNAANVRLLDSSNFQSFRSGRQHHAVGGHATQSPIRLQVPSSGHWYVVIDMGGYSGTVSSAVRVLPGRLPSIRYTPDIPLSSVPSLVQRQGSAELAGITADAEAREYDVFVSYASEDKAEVVRPLVQALQDHGLRVWYDEFELRIGDSLRRKIDKGLAHSRFGVVVFSKLFFNKGWTNYELDGLVTRSVSGDQVLLPIWHNVTKKEVVEYSASLADKVARSTSTHTVEEIAAEIAEVITGAAVHQS